MKSSELMIGDWVIDEYTNRPMRIEGVNKMMGSGLSPIPLTAEILEKNGFTQVKNEKHTYHKHLEDGYISVYIKKENAYIHYHNHECDSLNIKRRYVHELQHPLRLCGVGELANNFKI